jgi:hypothetical protein
MRTLFGIGTPRSLQGCLAAVGAVLTMVGSFVSDTIAPIWSQTDCPGPSAQLANLSNYR